MPATEGQGNPRWTKDETILALNAFFQYGDRLPNKDDEIVIELSKLLNKLPIHPYEKRKNNFRNPDGVSIEISGFTKLVYGKGLQTPTKIQKLVWEEYGDNPQEVSRISKIITNSCNGYFEKY